MMIGKNTGSDETWQRIDPGSVGIEIGVWRGDTSTKFLRRARHLHLVDSWSVIPYTVSDEHGTYDDYLDRYAKMVGSRDPQDFQSFYDNIYQSVVDRFQTNPVTIHRMSSRQFFAEFSEQADWIYIDGDHSYSGCLADLRSSLKVVRPGGTIFGDDYTNKPGVRRAVDQFVSETGMRFDNFHGSQYRIEVPHAS